MIGENLLRYNKTQRYLIFDCETCNLNLMDTQNVPWQWSWVDCTIQNVINKGNAFVKWPVINISLKVAQMTGFYQHTIDEEGIPPEEALERLDALIYDPQYRLIVHNGLNFDVFLHNIHRRLVGKPTDYSYLDRLIDTNALARAIKLEAKPQKDEDLLAFQYKFANDRTKGIKSSIESLCKEFDIYYDFEAAHDARWDVETLTKIWQKLVWQIEI